MVEIPPPSQEQLVLCSSSMWPSPRSYSRLSWQAPVSTRSPGCASPPSAESLLSSQQFEAEDLSLRAHRDVHKIVDEPHPRGFHCLRNSLKLRDLSLHDHRDVHKTVDEPHPRGFHCLNSLKLKDLSLRDHRDVHKIVDEPHLQGIHCLRNSLKLRDHVAA